MTTDLPDETREPAAARPAGRSSRQFSIRAMMIATAVLAVLCFIFFTLPSWVGGIFLLIVGLLLMPATLAALVYGRGRTRAFAVGASVPMGIVFLWFAVMLGSGFPFMSFGGGELESKIFFIFVIFIIVASGYVAQAVRWWCLRNED